MADTVQLALMVVIFVGIAVLDIVYEEKAPWVLISVSRYFILIYTWDMLWFNIEKSRYF